MKRWIHYCSVGTVSLVYLFLAAYVWPLAQGTGSWPDGWEWWLHPELSHYRPEVWPNPLLTLLGVTWGIEWALVTIGARTLSLGKIALHHGIFLMCIAVSAVGRNVGYAAFHLVAVAMAIGFGFMVAAGIYLLRRKF